MQINSTNTSGNEREQVLLLLPWYATGRLEPDEAERVRRFIMQDAAMAAELSRIRQEMDETISLNEALGAPKAKGLDRLMAAIGAEEGASRPATQRFAEKAEGFFSRLRDVLSPAQLSPLALRTAAAFAVLIIAVQAVALGLLIARQPGEGAGKTYQTASGPGEHKADGPVILISFAATAAIGEINALLEKTKTVIISGPGPGGVFRVRLDQPAAAIAERDAVIAELRKSALVKFALPGQ